MLAREKAGWIRLFDCFDDFAVLSSIVMSEICKADQVPFEPFDVCRDACVDQWTNALNAVPTLLDGEVSDIHYEGVEIYIPCGPNTQPDDRRCEAMRVNSGNDDSFRFVLASFKCIKEQS